ncbi:HAUS3 protein, partial [Crotophaga sulcirostris]|nr:HAUS3 protein [Crotophaga sulcirostris]
VNRGAEFVTTLRLFYPHADTLCEKDFDWLFDCPQTKQFLEWFCSTVTEENVLSPAEVEAYEALLAAGKPILEGEALKKALQTCCQVPQFPTMIPEDEGPSLEALQQELQELKDYRDCLLRRYNKVQVCAANLQQELSYLEEKQKVVQQDLRKAQMDLKEEICQTSSDLSQISEAAKQLAEWYRDTGKGRPPALLCEMDLSPYMELEQLVTDELERYIQQVLPGTVQAPDARGASEMDGSQEATDRTDAEQTPVLESLGTDGDELLEDQDSYWKELSRIEKAHICAQREVIVTTAKVEGYCAALEWAQRTLKALEENQHAVLQQLRRRAPMLQEQLHALRSNITQTLTHQLPPLLRAEARRATRPILQRQLSLEAARLQGTARRQEEVAEALANQHSRLQLLQLQLKRERKEVDQKDAQLREMETGMKEFRTMLQELQDYFKDANSSHKHCPRTWVDAKDHSAVRLWDMLVGQDQEKRLFCSYEAIEAQCSQLVQEKKVLEAQLAAPVPQLPALESSTEVLYRQLYDSSNQLQLSSPEITKVMQQLTTLQDDLHQMLVDLLSDLKVKRKSLENPIVQTEHNLYVYYYCNEDRLREVVEELEKQVLASSQ